MSEITLKIRVDKWLWQARFFKTRSLAAKLVSAGHMRVNGAKIGKPAYSLVAGDVLTFPVGDAIRVVRILALGTRRGPAIEAQALYLDLSEKPEATPTTPRRDGNARPDKRQRRQIDLLRARNLE